MPITAPIICRQPAEFVPSLTSTVVAVGGGTAASETLRDFVFTVLTTTTGTQSYDITQSVPQFLPDWTLTSETPAICSVSGNRVTKVGSGMGVIRATGPHGFSKVVTLDFTGSTSASEIWTGITPGTKSAALSNPILSLLSPAKQKNIYSSYGVKNANCWAAPMDLTASPIANSYGGQFGTANSGALITPQHWVGVAHWDLTNNPANMGPGATITCVGSDGIIHTRTVVQRVIDRTLDRIVSRLDSPFPATVKPFKLAGLAMRDAGTSRFYGMGWQITQEKNISPCSYDASRRDYVPAPAPAVVWAHDWTNRTDARHRMYGLDGLIQQGRPGDSGGAIGGYYNGETYLVSLFGSRNSGFLYTAAQAPELNAIIAALDAAQGISTGYQVGVLLIL